MDNNLYFNNSNGIASSTYLNPNRNVIIETDEIKLHHKGIDITIDVSNDILSKIDEITINGFKFYQR